MNCGSFLRMAAALALGGCVAAPAVAQDYVLPAHASVAGKALGVYAAEWWQWSLSMPLDESPVKDLTGEKCSNGQKGEVWFLAGTYENEPITRRCAVPQGRYLFFPIINMVYWRPPDRPVDCEVVERLAAVNNDSLKSIRLRIDGKNVPAMRSHREKSPGCFDVFARVSKQVTAPPGYPAATDGYWVMVKPLPAGKHVIRFGAQYARPGSSWGDLTQDVTYEIEVR